VILPLVALLSVRHIARPPPRHRSHVLRETLLHAVCFVFYVAMFELALQIFQQPACAHAEFAGAPRRLTLYPWILCSNAGSLRAVTYCFGVIYLLGLPAMYFGLLIHHRCADRTVSLHDTKQLYPWYMAFLTEGYHPRLAWYEIIWIIRRLVIPFIVAMTPQNIQPPIVIAVLLLSAFLSVALRPFEEKIDNMLDFSMLLAVVIAYTLLTTASSCMACAWLALIILLLFAAALCCRLAVFLFEVVRVQWVRLQTLLKLSTDRHLEVIEHVGEHEPLRRKERPVLEELQ
jgi:hypothetical protein